MKKSIAEGKRIIITTIEKFPYIVSEFGAEQKNNTETRMNLYIANGISGLIVALFMIFVSAIACIIMMKIYVHNTALVEQPLKLGRFEA